MTFRQHIDRYIWYYIVFAVSLILLFLPFLGSASLGLALPATVAGWIVFVTTKLTVAAVNVVIFHAFFKQAQVNVRDDPKYIEASQILERYHVREEVLLSPEEHISKAYRKKGVLTFITSVMGAFALGQAVLTFNVALFVSYLITLLFGIISGIINMKSEEVWWCDPYWRFAKKVEKEAIEKEKEEKAKIEQEKAAKAEAEKAAAASIKEEQQCLS